MSNGAVLKLLINDGKQDRILLGYGCLYKKFLDLNKKKKKTSKIDILHEIQTTHLIFTEIKFKPFIQVCNQYKYYIAQGTSKLNTCIEFSLNNGGGGDFISDMVLNIELDLEDVVTYDDNIMDREKPLLRWCNYPGERIIDKIEFTINGDVIDEYTSDDIVILRNFKIPNNKIKAYNNIVGQENLINGYLERNIVQYNADNSLDYRAMLNVTNGLQTPKLIFDKKVQFWIPLHFWFCDIQQALPRLVIPSSDLKIRIFLTKPNKLIGLIPRGQFEVQDNIYNQNNDFKPYVGTHFNNSGATINYDNLKITKLNLIVNHLYVPKEIHEIYMRKIFFKLIRVYKHSFKKIINNKYKIEFNDLKWPIENFYIGIQLDDYYSNEYKTIARNLDKWDQYNFIETKYINIIEGLRINSTANIFSDIEFIWNNGNINESRLILNVAEDATSYLTENDRFIVNWINNNNYLSINFIVYEIDPNGEGLNIIVVKGRHPDYTIDTDYNNANGSIIIGGLTNRFSYNTPLQVKTFEKKEMMNDINITMHNIDIIENINSNFYKNYTPYKFGCNKITPLQNNGISLINFSHYPESYQPSGYINFSRNKRFYVEYTSDIIGTTRKDDYKKCYRGELRIFCTPINFLLISDGSMVLRYLT